MAVLADSSDAGASVAWSDAGASVGSAAVGASLARARSARSSSRRSPRSWVSSSSSPSSAAQGRRISGFDELRDGGFGVGSAAPLDDGAQPLDHPVAAYRDTMTYRVPGDAGYDSAEPHVWFYDEAAAERSGFRRHQG